MSDLQISVKENIFTMNNMHFPMQISFSLSLALSKQSQLFRYLYGGVSHCQNVLHLKNQRFDEDYAAPYTAPSNVVFHPKISFIKSYFPSKVIFHQRFSSIKGCPPSKVIFPQTSSQRSSCIKVRLASKVVYHQRLSSIKGRLPSN